MSTRSGIVVMAICLNAMPRLMLPGSSSASVPCDAMTLDDGVHRLTAAKTTPVLRLWIMVYGTR